MRRTLPPSPRSRALPALLAAATLLAFFDCSLTSIGVAPLPDLGPGPYLPGVTGGLYPGGENTRPAAHEAAGLAIATTEVLPRDASGAVDLASGRVCMISIGMSNTTQEFDGGPYAFKPRADADPAKHPRLVIVDGAQGGKAADEWADPAGQPWQVLAQRLAQAGVAPAQVQVAWIKQAEKFPGPSLGPFPAHAQVLQDHLAQILNNLVGRYPNVRLAYLSSRTRAWTDAFNALNPEPFAYESGFSVRGVIAQQLAGEPALSHQPPGAQAPWLSWGPYLWADGTTPRSDGFTWPCSDTIGDFTHPSTSGATKVADQLLAFFKTDPTTVPWFLRTPGATPPDVTVVASVTSGPAPLVVEFSASAADPGAVLAWQWTFDDGLFAEGPAPTKGFPAPGEYDVRLTVTEADGDTATVTTHVSVGGPWTDLGQGLAGGAGVPVLTGSGTLQGASPVALHLAGAVPFAPVTLVIGLSPLGAPFKGGTLVPAPDVLVTGAGTGANGALNLSGTWPAGLPAGATLLFQEWLVDAAGPAGYAASNGLQAVTP